MRHLFSHLRALSSSMVLAVFVVAAHPAGAKETVSLTFGWPSGLQANVAFSVRTSQTVKGQRFAYTY